MLLLGAMIMTVPLNFNASEVGWKGRGNKNAVLLTVFIGAMLSAKQSYLLLISSWLNGVWGLQHIYIKYISKMQLNFIMCDQQ